MSELAQKGGGNLRRVILRDRDTQEQMSNDMLDIKIGSPVRRFYDEDTFDEGEVISVSFGFVEVDFFDWIERLSLSTDFQHGSSYLEAKEFLVLIGAGEIIADYRVKQ